MIARPLFGDIKVLRIRDNSLETSSERSGSRRAGPTHLHKLSTSSRLIVRSCSWSRSRSVLYEKDRLSGAC